EGAAGQNLRYLVRDCYGRDLACVLFGAAAWKVKDRDAFIGWSAQERQQRLSLITNNSRFLILPHVRVPHLASHILGTILRRLRCDWQRKYHLAPCLRLSEMAPEVEALRAQNTSLHRQLEVKTKRIAELREALEAARARCAPSGCSFPHRATKARGWCPSGRGASTDIPVPSATSPITSMSTLRSNSVRAHTVVACSSRTRMRSSS